jgi:hypothetical protein
MQSAAKKAMSKKYCIIAALPLRRKIDRLIVTFNKSRIIGRGKTIIKNGN